MNFKIVSVFLTITIIFVGFGLGVAPAGAMPPVEDTGYFDPFSEQVDVGSMSPSALNLEAVLQDVVMPERDLLDLAIRLKRAPSDTPRVVSVDSLERAVGDQQIFWISDQLALSYFQTTATLRYITPHVYMWVENGYNVSDEGIQRSAERFETQTYPLTRQLFGSEWTPGVDGDPHISIFNGYVPGVGGYYSSADEFSNVVNPYSNQREMFYINLDNAAPGSDYYDGILAHEFQHMIHWHSDRNEMTWVNEGLSELAAQINGLGTSGSVNVFVNQPDTQLTHWPDSSGEAAANYGAAHSFMNYVFQRFGDGVIRDIVAEKENGLEGIDRVLQARGLGITATDVFADWVVANYLGNPEVGEDGRFGPRLVQTPPRIDAVHDVYPVERSTEVRQFGADYIELHGTGDVQVHFEAPIEVKIVDNEAYSGQYQWWSNRGDDSDMTLTRPFDLRGIPSATLEFWMWYDIERDWDYAYVEISTDGGVTWDILEGAHSSDYNPNGNSFGWAYTGTSGGGEVAAWTQESIDLTPYVGQEVLIRFEYVTDDAVNHVGLCLDDISIPELGYFDDVEDAGGWDADGFVRSTNRLPQRFLLQLVEFGPEIRVHRLGSPTPAEDIPSSPNQEPMWTAYADDVVAEFECQPYEVQANDNLWKLAERFLGNGAASDVLIAATNAYHNVDSTYAQIQDPRTIRRGWKLCVPGSDAAREAMLTLPRKAGQPVDSHAPSPSSGPALVTGSYQFVVRGLGREVERTVLIVSGVAPVTTELAPYRYAITPLPESMEENDL